MVDKADFATGRPALAVPVFWVVSADVPPHPATTDAIASASARVVTILASRPVRTWIIAARSRRGRAWSRNRFPPMLRLLRPLRIGLRKYAAVLHGAHSPHPVQASRVRRPEALAQPTRESSVRRNDHAAEAWHCVDLRRRRSFRLHRRMSPWWN